MQSTLGSHQATEELSDIGHQEEEHYGTRILSGTYLHTEDNNYVGGEIPDLADY